MTMGHEFIYGLHAVNAVLHTQPERIDTLYIQQGREDTRMQAIVLQAQQQVVTLVSKTRQQLDDLVPGKNHQGVLASCAQGVTYTEYDLQLLVQHAQPAPLLLILDRVQDPHNLGACLRSADAAGVHAVIVPKAHAVAVTPAVRKVACGAAETVPLVVVSNLARTLRQLQEYGVWLYGACAEAEQRLYAVDLTGPAAVLLGAEGHGLRELTRKHCDTLFAIPMAGTVSSLNVSVATGICLFEAVRQRGS